HKSWCKHIVAAAGVPTADWTLIEQIDDVDRITLALPLLAKPVAEGTGKGVTPRSVIRDRADLRAVVVDLLERYRQPVLLEAFLPGREFTVGLLGTGDSTRALGTLEIVLREGAEADVYSYQNKEECESRIEYRHVTCADPLVAESERIAIAAWRVLGCRDGGRIDLRCDAVGKPMFLEVNPLAGLHPSHSDLPMIATAVGLPYAELIRQIIDSAATRIVPERNRAGRFRVA